jgi:hypothetical protein
MNSELFVKIILAIISICGALVTAYVIPFIKSKISSTELNKLFEYVKIAVRCAEQIYTVEQWQEKKEYVMNYVMNIMNEKLHIELSYDQIDTIVEGIVNEVKHNVPTMNTFISNKSVKED